MDRPRILLADDHPMILEGLGRLLERECEIVGKVEDGRALVEASQRFKLDVVVLDLSMPLLNGLEAARQIKKIAPKTKLIFLTMHADATYANEAFQVGASGYLLKRSAASELHLAIRRVLQGQSYLTPLLETGDRLPQWQERSKRGLHKQRRLTPRQREVLQLIGEGKSTKQIATILNISIKTVEFHKSKVMETLGIHTTAKLTKYAIAHGLVGP